MDIEAQKTLLLQIQKHLENGLYESDLLEMIYQVSQFDTGGTDFLLHKIMEEVGEVTVAHLQLHGKKKTNKDHGAVVDNLLEEACDIIITAGAYLKAAGFTQEDVTEMMRKKLLKYANKLEDSLDGV